MIERREYTYLGDKLTDPKLKGARCHAVLTSDGKCVTKNSVMLVRFAFELVPRVVLRRRLRKVDA